jgi:hypothetical protein
VNEIVRFIGRSADPHAIKIGNEAENLAQAIKFELPHEFKYATVFLHIQFGYYADVVNLGDDRIFKPTRTHTQKPGRYTAYLEALIDGDVVWKSDVFYLHVGSLPNDGELIEKKYPTAFEEVMKTVASLTDINVEAETLPPGSNATVRLERDENGKAVLVYGLPQGEQGVSPTVDVKPINNGHRITVTDAEGVKTFDVSYGEVSQILTDRVVSLEQDMAEVKKITDNFELFVPKFANTAEGETLVLTDSADGALQGMTVYGKTTQDGTPTPDAPVPLVSAGDDGAVDVTVEGSGVTQTLTLSTPNGLPSVGDVYDEIDLERGVYVQRVGKIAVDTVTEVYDDGRVWYTVVRPSSKGKGYSPVASTHFVGTTGKLNAGNVVVTSTGNIQAALVDQTIQTADAWNAWLTAQTLPLEIVYTLATPIETPLSAEEITAFKALKTHYPTTTIYNDEAARMAIKYAADTKNYIDNHLAALAAAMVNNL